MSHVLSSQACCLHVQTPFIAVPSPNYVQNDTDAPFRSSNILCQSLSHLGAFAIMAESHHPTLHPREFLLQFLTHRIPFLSFHIHLWCPYRNCFRQLDWKKPSIHLRLYPSHSLIPKTLCYFLCSSNHDINDHIYIFMFIMSGSMRLYVASTRTGTLTANESPLPKTK